MSKMCDKHPAFEADYCPSCGTARPVGMTTSEVIAYAEHDAALLAADEREFMIADVRDIHGDIAAALVRDGWTVDSAIAHVLGDCDRAICFGSHDDEPMNVEGTPEFAAAHGEEQIDEPRVLFSIDIDCEGDAFAQSFAAGDPIELQTILRNVADRLGYGETAGTLRDSNGNSVGTFAFSGRDI